VTPTPLDILVVATRFPLASETFVRQQCTDLVALGHRVEILTLRAGDDSWTEAEHSLGLPTRLRSARLEAPRATRLLRAAAACASLACGSPAAAARVLASTGPRRAHTTDLLAIARALGGTRRFDAIHCHFGPAGLVALDAVRAGLLHGTLGVGFYGYDLTREPLRRGADLYAPLFDARALLLPHSGYLADRLRALGAPPDRLVLHHLGIDLTRFTPVNRGACARPLRALAIGRFVEKKGFAHLLRALAACDPSTTLRLVGDGPLRPELERLRDELGLRERVVFPGWRTIDGITAELGDADVLVAPSVTAADGDMEGLPLVVIEAMATGLPVIGSAHSGIPEVVLDGETGIVTPERDNAALAAALDRMRDADSRKKMGAAARARVEHAFDGRLLAADLCEHYRRNRPADPHHR
jgi:colanic acid/amylovoran biosynthesis glycosyltransferase